jgi:hypothetical protein
MLASKPPSGLPGRGEGHGAEHVGFDSQFKTSERKFVFNFEGVEALSIQCAVPPAKALEKQISTIGSDLVNVEGLNGPIRHGNPSKRCSLAGKPAWHPGIDDSRVLSSL